MQKKIFGVAIFLGVMSTTPINAECPNQKIKCLSSDQRILGSVTVNQQWDGAWWECRPMADEKGTLSLCQQKYSNTAKISGWRVCTDAFGNNACKNPYSKPS